MKFENKKTYICIANCSELDFDNSDHCIMEGFYINDKIEYNESICPCGNLPIWKEFKENN